MQSSGQTPRSSKSPSRIETSSTAATTPPKLNIHGTTPVDHGTLSGERKISDNSDHGAITSRPTSTGSDQSYSSPPPYQYGSRKLRNSGGFLLPDPSSGLESTAMKSTNNSVDTKGKRKVEEGDITVSKRTIRNRHRLKPSLGTSPLAIELLNATPTADSEPNHRNEGEHLLAAPSREPWSAQSSLGSNHLPEGRRKSSEEAKVDAPPALGFDTDPAQIVNLALSLSESRRRNFSGGLLAPVNGTSDRRVISASSPRPGLTAGNVGGSLRQHLQEQRRISRNISPRSGLPKRRDASPGVGQNGNPTRSSIVQTPDFVQPSDPAFNPSDATLSRAEKARTALELSYEYRRLLQYLPKIPTANVRHTNARESGSGAEGLGTLGRSYNPLQYIRNRKVRLRERRPFDSEAEGWRILERVRQWIDTVASERDAGIATVDDRFPLPSFDLLPTDSQTADGLLAQSPTKPNPVQNSKQRRPRVDWTITPWDMLADAYWLQHDGNITHIEDSTGRKIISSSDSYKVPSAKNSLEIDRASYLRADSTDRQAISPVKIRPLKANVLNERSTERGRREEFSNEQEAPKQRADGSRDRKGRWSRKLIRSKSFSSASESDRDDPSRHRRGRHRDRDYLDSSVLEKHMNSLLAQEGADEDQKSRQSSPQARSKLNSKDNGISLQMQGASTERSRNADKSKPSSVRTSARSSLERSRGRHRATSFDDLDATAPSSPTVPGFTPSIAISLSRPSSPHVSPKKPLPSFRPARSKERQAISENDFALSTPSTTDLSRQGTRDSKSEDPSRRERYKNEMNGFLSPTTESFGKMFRRSEGGGKPLKESHEHDSKLRGFFRGGRIAEIVGNEVGRVGDRLWRKDANHQASQVATPVSGYASDESESDVESLDGSPEANLSRTSTNIDGKPKYHIANLPSFQSTFTKDDQAEESSAKPSVEDPISRQQLVQRQRGRSARFERLAPPKIDMRSISPSPAPPLTRTQTRNTVPSYDPFDSRQSSTNRSEGRVRDADRRLNAVLGVPGTIGLGGPPMTGLAALESRYRRSRERPVLEGKRQWSISDRSVSAVRGNVTMRDIARVRALLLSSGVKANEIARRAHETVDTSSPVLHELREISRGPLPRVPRSQEHAVAARIYASHIDDNNKQLRDAAERFSNTTVDRLHEQTKGFDERVTQELTPLARRSADEADAFGAQLTTTHTLEVKQLNDAVDAILRRRRRRLRWVRRVGYVLLEWTLLGIMWWVWLIVVIVRLIRGTTRGFVSGIKWLLWL